VTIETTVEDLLRELAPQVLAALVRRYGHGQFHLCEDATQEALLAAAVQWPGDGIPDSPRGWLTTVAARKLLDQVRSEQSRRQREDRIALATPQSELLAAPADVAVNAKTDQDDSLALLFGCCHPELSTPSQIALTLRAIGGLSTAQIAAAFGVPEATMAQRISRAKQGIKDADFDFTLPTGAAERGERLQAVLHVLYLVFNEGYTASDGDAVTVPALSGEAIRLTRWLHRLLPGEPEVAGLLALMLLTDARRAARTQPDGSLVPLAEQDRSRWDRDAIDEGTALISAVLARGQVGPYQLQAAIAAVHDEAATMDDTDWAQILGLYDLLELAAPNPFTALNRAVAVGMVHGPEAALAILEQLAGDKRMAKHHRLFATRAYLLEQAGEQQKAAETYRQAARLAVSVPERRYLATQAKRLGATGVARTLCLNLEWVSDRDRAPGEDVRAQAAAVNELLDDAGAGELLQVQAGLADLGAEALHLADVEALADQVVEPDAAGHDLAA
jgi:RNA polymerase sigma factor (sigma-70 family)